MANRQLASAAARVGRLSILRNVGQRSFSIVPSISVHSRQTDYSRLYGRNDVLVHPFSTATEEPTEKKEEIEFQA